MRYCYHNAAYRRLGSAHGVLCDPVRRADGRCILSPSSQLVTFEDGHRAVVIRRALRLRGKCEAHGGKPKVIKMIPAYNWLPIKDGDPRAYTLMTRHYSFNRYADRRRSNPAYRNRQLFVGPGEKLVLMTVDCNALFVWRKFIDGCPGQSGVNCAVFRNESPLLSSDLILEAEEIAWGRWPGERLYTYVDPAKVSNNPGYCFKMAGWEHCGVSGSGKHILEKRCDWGQL